MADLRYNPRRYVAVFRIRGAVVLVKALWDKPDAEAVADRLASEHRAPVQWRFANFPLNGVSYPPRHSPRQIPFPKG